MDIYKIHDIEQLIGDNPYVGRGIILGMSEDKKSACAAYFIMGRSSNSRNRIFEKKDGVVYTKPFDESKVQDPSLIIYAAVREYENHLIVTNGDQTDTIYEGLKAGKCMRCSLKKRKFEPDAPNFTPRISGVVNFDGEGFDYELSILKSADAEGSECNRYTFDYKPLPGLGHFTHTYVTDGSPIPTFQGEPERLKIPNSAKEFANDVWAALNEDNKISLYVRYTDIRTKKSEEIIINKYNKA